MTWFEGLVLGIVQGLTEFLPVSSTGHLIITRELFGFAGGGGLAVDATLHLATALAVFLYFRKDLLDVCKSLFAVLSGKQIEFHKKTLLYALVLGSVPAVVIGVMLEDMIDTVFRDISLVAYALLAGSALLVAAEWFAKQQGTLSVQKGVALGFFQALALIPGMSRSGSVISGGLLLGLKREEAARFAFLLAFPIILGAGGKKFLELSTSGGGEFGFPLLVASLAAFISGLAAIHFLVTFLRTHTLYPFAVYRVALALYILLYLN